MFHSYRMYIYLYMYVACIYLYMYVACIHVFYMHLACIHVSLISYVSVFINVDTLHQSVREVEQETKWPTWHECMARTWGIGHSWMGLTGSGQRRCIGRLILGARQRGAPRRRCRAPSGLDKTKQENKSVDKPPINPRSKLPNFFPPSFGPTLMASGSIGAVRLPFTFRKRAL